MYQPGARCVVYSQDGLLASGGDDVRVWSADGTLLRRLLVGGRVNSLALAGARLAAAGEFGLMVWNALTGHLVGARGFLGGELTAVALSDSGRLILGDIDGGVRVMDLTFDGYLDLGRPGEGPVVALGLLGNRIVCAAGDYRPTIRVMSGAGDSLELAKLDPLVHASWCSQSSMLATLTTGGVALVSLDPLRRLGEVSCPRNSDSVYRQCIALAPGGNLVAVGDTAGGIVVLDTMSGGVVISRRCSRGFVSALAFDPDGERLAVAASEAPLTVWDLRTGSCLPPQPDLRGEIAQASFTTDGRIVSLATLEPAAVSYDIRTGKQSAVWRRPQREVCAISPHPDSMATGDNSGRLWLWEGAPTITQAHDWRITQIVRASRPTLFATAGLDHCAKLWSITDAATLSEIVRLHCGQNIFDLALSGSGHTMGAALLDGSVLLWRTDVGGLPARRLPATKEAVARIAFVGERRCLTIGRGGCSRLRLWDLDAGVVLWEHAFGCQVVAAQGLADWVVAATAERLHVFRQSVLVHEVGLDVTPACLSISPDGACVVLGCEDGTALVVALEEPFGGQQ